MGNTFKQVDKLSDELTLMIKTYFARNKMGYSYLHIELKKYLTIEIDDKRIIFDKDSLEFIAMDYELPYNASHCFNCKKQALEFVNTFKTILQALGKQVKI